jgi:AcrR family transcriptional regulator
VVDRRLPSPTETAIFAATEELLAENSIADLPVALILERAGVSRTTFYRYYASKSQIVSALLTRVQAELVDVMQPWFNRGDRAPQDALDEAMRSVAEVWRAHRPVMRASTESWHSDREIGERWMAMMDRFTDDIARQIERERRRGSAPRGVDSRRLAQLLTWSSERMLYLGGFGLTGPGDELGTVETLVSMWMKTIYGVVETP